MAEYRRISLEDALRAGLRVSERLEFAVRLAEKAKCRVELIEAVHRSGSRVLQKSAYFGGVHAGVHVLRSMHQPWNKHGNDATCVIATFFASVVKVTKITVSVIDVPACDPFGLILPNKIVKDFLGDRAKAEIHIRMPLEERSPNRHGTPGLPDLLPYKNLWPGSKKFRRAAA